MGLMFPFNSGRRFLRRGNASILHPLPNWKRATDVCIACFHKCVHSLLTLYLRYKQMGQCRREERHPFSIRPYIASIEEKLEIQRQRIEALERTLDLDALGALEERLVKIESHVTQ